MTKPTAVVVRVSILPPALRTAGFTLIELLIVIGILSVLIVAFAPNLFGAFLAAEEGETKARQLSLVGMIEEYTREFGDAPPDDFSLMPGQQWDLGNDNGKNSGIESLVLHLSFEARSGGKLDEHLDWLANTDLDRTPTDIPLLGTRDKQEVVDAWGRPFAYFSARVGGMYQKPQRIVGPTIEGTPGEEMVVTAVKDPRSGAWLNPRKYQIVSAGADGIFGNEDDVTYPAKSIEQ